MAARLLDCPQCGAPVNFRSSIAVFAVCEHCRSMIVLRGAEAERIGEMAALPPDLSPFQIGTTGEWKGRGFEIVGRLRVEWEQGSWNEWCIAYDTNTTGWLAEAQGLLMFSFPHLPAEALPSDPGDYHAQRRITLDQRIWTVADRKVVTYRAAEGELPFPIEPGQTRLSADLSNERGGFATVELTEDGAELFLGEYADFNALRLTNLRPVPGWSTEVAQENNRTLALSCPSCGGTIELRAAGQSMSAVCGSCGAVIDTATPELKIIEQAEQAVRNIAPKLPIGQRGKLFDTEYEVMGLVRCRDSYSQWDEYLLFNPWQGFRWLVTYNGHWSFITRLTSVPSIAGRTASYNARHYKLYADSKVTAIGVLGEFYWKVQRGETAQVFDFIAPPRILSQEKYPELHEVAWSEGEYVDRKVIAQAFAVKDLPRPQGIYLNQPNRFRRRLREVIVPFVLAVFSLCFIQLISTAQMKESELVKTSFVYQPSQSTARPFASTATPPTPQVLTTPRFKLEGGEQRLVLEANAPVNNNWIYLDIDLVNAATNASTPANLEVSAYHGYDSDGAWSEGSQTSRFAFPAVPPGEYFFTIEPSADSTIQQMPFTISARAGGVFNSNFVIMLVLVLLYPGYLIWRSSSFEKRRWAESDYTA